MAPELYGKPPPADSALTAEQIALKNPLLFQFKDGALAPLLSEQGTTAKSPVMGYALIADTGKVNSILRMPAVKAALGNDLRLLWSAKSTGNVSTLYAIRTRAVVERPSWTARASSTPASDMTRSVTWSAT